MNEMVEETEKIIADFSEEEKIQIIKVFPLSIILFDNPSAELQTLAYAQNKDVIKIIKNPHPGLNLMDM